MKIFKKIKDSFQMMYFQSTLSFSLYSLTFLMIFYSSCKKHTENIRLEKGMVISESVTVAKDTFKINTDTNLNSTAVIINGENLVVDFQGAVLVGSNDKTSPDELYGIGIKVQGKNIEIKNLKVQGYRLGLQATNVQGLKINNSEFNYNHRCRKINKINHFSNCTSFLNPTYWHSGIEIFNCQDIEISKNRITNNNFGIVFNYSQNGKIFNNFITHNSEDGIFFIDTDSFKVMHNFLDWNKKNGFRNSSQSKNNIIAYNSITHCNYYSLAKNINFSNNRFPKNWIDKNLDSLQKIYPPIKNGQKTDSLLTPYKGEKYILNNEWGPYNFQYPAIWLREINDDKYTFAIFGPEGNWKIVNGNGFVQTSRQSGSTPATIVATRAENYKEPLSLDLEFIGVEFTDQFGRNNHRGKTYKFGFKTREE